MPVSESVTYRKLQAVQDPAALFDQLKSKESWSNAELLWAVQRFQQLYVVKDRFIKQSSTVAQLMERMELVCRAFATLVNNADPTLADNWRKFVKDKLVKAAYGLGGEDRR